MPGVVDQHVDAAVALHDRIHHGLNRGAVGDVDDEAVRLAAHVADAATVWSSRASIEITDDDPGALARELERSGVPDAASRAGDDGDFARQPHASFLFLCCSSALSNPARTMDSEPAMSCRILRAAA